jgi:hypothetical protein
MTHLPSYIYLHLPVLIVVVSLVYGATRYDQWRHILHEAFRWGMRMTAFLLGIALALYVISFLI